MEVPLCHVVLSLDQPVAIPRQEDSFSLALGLRLDDESLRPLAIEILLETFSVCRKYPSLGKEIVIVREYLLKHLEVLGQ